PPLWFLQLDLLPAELRHRPRALPGLQGLRARGVPCDGPRHHALEDRGGAEHVVRHAEAPILVARRATPRALEVPREVFPFRRDAERREVASTQSAEFRGRKP